MGASEFRAASLEMDIELFCAQKKWNIRNDLTVCWQIGGEEETFGLFLTFHTRVSMKIGVGYG